MESSGHSPEIPEPFPIFTLAHKYMLYDVNVVTYIRQKYNVCGVLIGGLPQAPQQNVFLGIPLELMPEEARLLVDKGAAYVADDVRSHKQGFLDNGLSVDEQKAFQASLSKQGQAAAKDVGRRADERKKAALTKKLGADNWNDIPEDMLLPSTRRGKKKGGARGGHQTPTREAQEDGESLFGPPGEPIVKNTDGPPKASYVIPTGSSVGRLEFAITPTTSHPPLRATVPTADHAPHIPEVPQSYPLYKHLHEEGYFMAPGLRFGCQYTAYPGDPLRFHSHFLCNGMDWDDEFDLLDIVGGGRLGTGVKKGFLVGGVEQKDSTETVQAAHEKPVRAFCIEWGGM